jgi:hypothetical protein
MQASPLDTDPPPDTANPASMVEITVPSHDVQLLPLAGTSADALGGEIFDHRDEWIFGKLAPALGKRPVLLITASDGTGPTSETLLQTLKTSGNNRSQHIEIETDHPFSGRRLELEHDILTWLEQRRLIPL